VVINRGKLFKDNALVTPSSILDVKVVGKYLVDKSGASLSQASRGNFLSSILKGHFKAQQKQPCQKDLYH